GSWKNQAPALLSQNSVVELDIDPDGGLWISTESFGISYRSAGDEWTAYTKIRSDVGNDNALSYYSNNLALLYDSQGFLWCNAQNYDLDRIEINDPLDRDDDSWEHYSLLDGNTITANRFVEAAEDPAGNRWFMSDDEYMATNGYGIDILSADGANWLHINPVTRPLMRNGNVFDCVFSGTYVYLALRGFGVQRWNTRGFDWPALESEVNDAWVPIIDDTQLRSTNLSSLALGADGSIWTGTDAGLVRYKSGRVDVIDTGSSLTFGRLIDNKVNDLVVDRDGNLWVATGLGLNRIDPEGSVSGTYTTEEIYRTKFTSIYPKSIISPLPSPVCKCLAYDADRNFLWIGTANGLVCFDVTPVPPEKIALSEIIIYPNPIYISRGDESLRISRISGTVDVQIFSLEGELVHEASDISEGEEIWDLLTLNGYLAQSGIYLVRIIGEDSTENRKVALVR
ncbi:MAG: T9SS type A sorting domain-containing protein, partial [Candidatus Krumholzibacteriota bacterium]|nr:T9SS type A sorting domain-containing protein [Candidatus Krumholzibacteriota bacterium]